MFNFSDTVNAFTKSRTAILFKLPNVDLIVLSGSVTPCCKSGPLEYCIMERSLVFRDISLIALNTFFSILILSSA